MQLATIGFTQSTAECFFGRLQSWGAEVVVDIRLHNVSQLAGFAKYPDLPYLLRAICNADYVPDLSLAPTEELLKSYRDKRLSWQQYEDAFCELMRARDIPRSLDAAPYRNARTALLCSEATPEQCHRRLVADLLAREWGAKVTHL